MTANSNFRAPSAAPSAGSHGATTVICLVLLILLLLVFGQCGGFEFVNYDDDVFVTNNNHVLRGLTWGNLRWVLTAGIGKGAVDADYWRPVSFASHMLDVQFFGLSAGAHHVVNLALHALTVLALFLVLRSMTGRLWPSAFVAALFAIHPLHVESVAWVAERKDVLSGLCFMLTLGAYTRYARRPFHPGNYLLVVLLFVLGLMSKPMLVTLPCVLLLLDYWPLGRTGSVPLSRLLLEKVPLLALSAAVGVLTAQGPGYNDSMNAALSWPWRAGNAIVAYATYLRQTVWPAGLACLYPHPGKNLSPGNVSLAAGVLLAITLLVLWQRQRRYLAVGWFWYLGMLVPVIGFIQSGGQAHADRYTYLPLIGLSLMVTWAAADWAGQQRPRQVALAVMALFALSGLTVAAQRQTSHWRDSTSLWTHALENTQGNYVAHNNLGETFLAQGRTLGATECFQKALEIKPVYSYANNNLGVVLVQTGQLDEAIIHYQRVLTMDPNYAEAHNNLANALLQKGRVDEAISHSMRALELKPDSAGAHNNLGKAFVQKGQQEEGLTHYQQALEINPDHPEARYNLGNALLQKGKLEEAIAQYQMALKSKPDYPEACNNLGFTFFQKGQLPGASALYQRALKLKPDYVDAHNNLGNALLQQGQTAEALGHYEAAVKINPAELGALNNLAFILATNPEASVRNGARALELAQQADQLSGGNNPIVLHTLAAAQAETGHFTEAAETAARALSLANTQGNAALAEALRNEHDLYLAGKPLRQPDR